MTKIQSEKPLFIFDGDCRFCRHWVVRLAHLTGERVAYEPYQEVSASFPDIPISDFENAVQFMEADGRRTKAAEAVFRCLAYGRFWRWPLALYQHAPGFRVVSEWVYKQVARNRPFFSTLTHLLWGKDYVASSSDVSRWIFLRLLGFAYLAAFLSWSWQVKGLVGENGILPASAYLSEVAKQIPTQKFFVVPSLFWLNQNNEFLVGAAVTGVASSLGLILGVFPLLMLFLNWVIYLSFMSIGGDFLSFQWDSLLLETGFLAFFIAPLTVSPVNQSHSPPSKPVLFLLWWLLFRLMFSSGAVKLLSGDPTWANLAALQFHYETQPLPPWIAWYLHQLPLTFQKFSCGAMFFIELIAPFFIFAPRRPRAAALIVLAGLQGLIIVSGNYCFFNLLSLALCCLALDDASWPVRIREAIRRFLPEKDTPRRAWPVWLTTPVCAFLFLFSTYVFTARLGLQAAWPSLIRKTYQVLAPYYLVNSYGLFAVMTTTRLEIIVEGSNDGKTWQAYEFKYKPGDLNRRPAFVAPHQPRLDWQMWFAALGNYRQNRWFVSMCVRLLQGSGDVLKLLQDNPFPDSPPRYIRAVTYQYHFTDGATRKKTGAWWRREEKGLYLPPIGLK